MQGLAVRLQAVPGDAPRKVQFGVVFASDVLPEDATQECSPARLRPGDGSDLDLGMICAPTTVTWREHRFVSLANHTYGAPGPFTAELLIDGAVAASAVVELERAGARVGPAERDNPAVTLFALAVIPGASERRLLKIEVPAMPEGRRLRVDGGAGQVREFAGEAGQSVAAEIQLIYPKPGRYLVSLDLLDGEGFWLGTLAETELEISEEFGATELASAVEPFLPLPHRAPDESSAAAIPVVGLPWLPYRNIKSKPGGARTYTAPGGAARRWVGAGTWLSVRREGAAGGARWYQTAGGDWIKADAVVFFEPSDLRGVTLDATQPPPPPPPPGNRKGVVTASVLNVRARPGVSANNPPVASLKAGAQVVIYEEQQAGGEIWYRIGVDRWAAARFVRVVASRELAEDEARFLGKPVLPFGWVVPEKLEVRAKPGPGNANPAIDQLQHYQVVPILDEVTASGARWYRIGEQRWVEGRQIGVARRKARPAAIGATALWVAVNLSQQTAVCYEGDTPVYAALVATGLPGTPTVQGIFRTWRRLDTGRMSGPGYYIEDVTWACYFYSGYALHTAYWHDKFGRPRSHGCVNLSPYDAWWVHQWSANGGPNSPTVYVYWA